MKTNKFLLATGAISIAFLVATPAFAEDGRSEKEHADQGSRFELNLGKIARFFDAKDVKKDNDKKDKKDHREDKKSHATSSTSVSGTVTAVNGSTITLLGENAAVYTINASGAQISGNGRTIAITDIRVGDVLKVKGTVSSSSVIATHVTDKTLAQREIRAQLDNLRLGVVTSVTATGFTIKQFGAGTTTVTTNASTTVKAKGNNASSTIAVGSKVFVTGTTTSTAPDTILGSVVYVVGKGFGFLKHFFNR